MIATNVVHSASQTGDLLEDFQTGQDTIEIDFSTFSVSLVTSGSTGTLVDGANFSTITTAYDGTNPGTSTDYNSAGVFIYSTADQTLYHDDNGASAGYTVVATLEGVAPGTVALHASDVGVPS